ncbi:MAG TPA: hypothetical protein VJ910_04505 [Desulfuromonadales bacterium]|nr:hypothetical protein [Desulfuromonadales bacterium]
MLAGAADAVWQFIGLAGINLTSKMTNCQVFFVKMERNLLEINSLFLLRANLACRGGDLFCRLRAVRKKPHVVVQSEYQVCPGRKNG